MPSLMEACQVDKGLLIHASLRWFGDNIASLVRSGLHQLVFVFLSYKEYSG